MSDFYNSPLCLRRRLHPVIQHFPPSWVIIMQSFSHSFRPFALGSVVLFACGIFAWFRVQGSSLQPSNVSSPSLTKEKNTMKTMLHLHSGVITSRLGETKEFYTKYLGLKPKVDMEKFFLLFEDQSGREVLSFLMPNHETQQDIFKPEFGNKGVYLTVGVADVEAEYKRLQSLNAPIAFPLRKEVWGDYHFAITDPNGIGIDIVQFAHPEQ
jgi:catechol 2,3-dioxygenase-like lactoylglutathione lyase family enzyme